MAPIKKFHVGVKAVIIQDGKALILKDAIRFRGWDLPGGKIDENEGIEQALKRELEEEVGIKKASIGELLNVFERQDYNKEGLSIMLIFYKAEAEISEIKLSDEHVDYKWISKDDFNKMEENGELRNDGVKVALEKVLK